MFKNEDMNRSQNDMRIILKYTAINTMLGGARIAHLLESALNIIILKIN